MNGFYLFMHNTALKLNALITPRAGQIFFFKIIRMRESQQKKKKR